jgi:hypothetical protein
LPSSYVLPLSYNFFQHMSNEESVIVAARGSNELFGEHVESTKRMPNEHPTCVICLERISEKAIALPCTHANFDFACLGAWLQRQPSCPLCKASVHGIKYDIESPAGAKVFAFPLQYESVPLRPAPGGNPPRAGLRIRNREVDIRDGNGSDQDNALERRRQVYEHRTYSLHVGSNRLSRYRNLNPQAFHQDPTLLHRAKIWIRRELQVFEFLSSNSAPEEPSKRRARNAEFLGEYILAIIKSIDIRGSNGQAEELLQEFIGRENARLFLHELGNWLRSPYGKLRDWDDAVQYDNDALPSRNYPAGLSVCRNAA